MIVPLLFTVILSMSAAYQAPFCFRSGVTWTSEVSGGIQSVATPNECRIICADSSECDSVTWYSGESGPHGGDYCELFASPDPQKEAACENCTSGPDSCVCSGAYTCSLDNDQLVDLIFDVSSELRCAEMSFENADCEYYSWYSPESPTLKNTCALLRGCFERTGSTSCVSGPSNCIDTDVIESDYPLCFTSGSTWIKDTEKGVANITSPYDCQTVCDLDPQCSSFTWYNSLASPLPKFCEFYESEVSKPTAPCLNCVSGRSACSCSMENYSVCETNHDLVVSIVPEVETEVQCQDLCARQADCTWYTWYSARGDRLQLTCFLLTSCINTMTCQGCHSGPENCEDVDLMPRPAQCTQYKELDSFTRNVNVPAVTGLCGSNDYCCDQAGLSYATEDWSGPAYYRFTGPAGTQIAEAPGLFLKCGTVLGGYMLGGHPGPADREVTRTVYFDNSNGSPVKPTNITVTQCGDFYVYYLVDVPDCYYGYCSLFV